MDLTVQTRREAEQLLTGRCSRRRKVANNTYLERDGDNIAVRLHDTAVVTYLPNGDIVLDSGGWLTMTTKERMGTFTAARVSQTNGQWTVYWGDERLPYADRMILHPDGTADGVPNAAELAALDKDVKRRRRDIKKFVGAITAEQIVHAWENNDGDCWHCKFGLPGGTDHLECHIEEGYFMASLAYQAIKAAGYRSPDTTMAYIYGDAQRGQVSDLLTRALSKYLKNALIPERATR